MSNQTSVNSPTQYYQVGGDLGVSAPSYVVREADQQLYNHLKSGQFCYVLNSRQMGKSSLGVRIKEKLEEEDYMTAYIDLSGMGLGSLEQWYGALASRMAKPFRRHININWRNWWADHQLVSPSERLNLLIDEVILPSVPKGQKIIFFLDEIDFVRILPFKSDPFFILIRSFYNQRSQNIDYNRLNFCLLGVATPSDLIEDKQLTPFNIGEAITLKGFTIDEVEPLIKGLENQVNHPRETMQEILDWTGGQPFLTQRVCDLVVNQENRNPDVAKLVQRNIVDNWDDPDQDKQEHLRTIRNRIKSNEQRSGMLLEVYRTVLRKKRVEINSSREEKELQLSGLVVKKGSVLEVYNSIYAHVFNESWVDAELEKLRPYSENYRAWIQSGKTDASRLLRGKALKEAEKWADGKNLGGEDRDFISASHARERVEQIEQMSKEAVKKRNQTYRKAITIAMGMITIASMIVITTGIRAYKTRINLDVTNRLAQLSEGLQEKYPESAKDALALAGLSVRISDNELKRSLLWTGISLTHQYLAQRDYDSNQYNDQQIEHWQEAEKAIKKSLVLLQQEPLTTPEAVTIAFFTYSVFGNLLEEHEFVQQHFQQPLVTKKIPSYLPQTSLQAYQQAFWVLQKGQPPLVEQIPETITQSELIGDSLLLIWQSLNNQESMNIKDNQAITQQRDNLRNFVQLTWKKHYTFLSYIRIRELEAELKVKNWKKADTLTTESLFYLGYSHEISNFSYRNLSCKALKQIDILWRNSSNNKFGFKAQSEVYKATGNTIGRYEPELYNRFGEQVGWWEKGAWKSYDQLIWQQEAVLIAPKGHFPVGLVETAAKKVEGVFFGLDDLAWGRGRLTFERCGL